MSDQQLSLPVPYHETFQIYDSSKIKAFTECPRAYFYRYVLGWTSDRPNNHLVFGTAFHKGMEQLLLGGYTIGSIDNAYSAFIGEYREIFPEETDVETFPKTPGMALRAFTMYTSVYAEDVKQFDVKHTEVWGMVLVNDQGRKLCFRIDAIVERNGYTIGLEHKTATKRTGTWEAQWDLATQMFTYTHVLNSISDKSDGVIINGVFFYKGKQKAGDITFGRIPIRTNGNMMIARLWRVNWYVDMIEYNFKQLSQCTDKDAVMRAFPPRECYCTAWYRTCPYHTFCRIWPNALQHIDRVPAGMKCEFWDPRDYKTEAREVMDLSTKQTKIGAA